MGYKLVNIRKQKVSQIDKNDPPSTILTPALDQVKTHTDAKIWREKTKSDNIEKQEFHTWQEDKKRRQALEKIETRGGVDYLQDFLMTGGTISTLAKDLDLNRGYLHRLLINHEEYSKAIEEVREKRRTRMRRGFQIFEDLAQERQRERDLAEEGSRTKDLNQVDVAIAREKASQHRFAAQAWNQARYGNKAGQTEVTISLGDMHLDALRKMKRFQDATKVIENDD